LSCQGIPACSKEVTELDTPTREMSAVCLSLLVQLLPSFGLPAGDVPPAIPPDVKYQRVVGSDVMYEPLHAKLVAAVLAHRLVPGGCALLCCAVRQLRTFQAFETACRQRGLRYRTCQVISGMFCA